MTELRRHVENKDANGNVSTVTDDGIATGASPLYAYTYDARDRAVSSTAHHLVTGGGTPRTFVHTHAIDDAPRSLALHSAVLPTPGDLLETTTLAYDPQGLLDTIDFPGGGAIDLDYGYYPDDLLQSLTRPASGVSAAFTQFASGPVQQITVSNGSGELHDLVYPPSTGYDANWNVTRIDESVDGTPVAAPATYGYDGFDRLTDPALPGLYGQTISESWTYDDAGNRDETASPGSYTYDANDRLRTVPGKTYHYDPDGNPTEIRDGADTTVLATLTWDQTNRLVSYTKPATGAVTTFLYDPFGRRVEKTHDPDGPGGTSSTTTRYLWNGDQLYGEYQGGARTVRYGYGGGFMPVQVAYGSETSETVYDVHGDHLGTPRMITGDSGSVVWRAAYDAYGEAHVDPGSSLGQAFNIRFPGQYFDQETGLHYNRFRYYDPSVGRYISADPIGQFGGEDTNLYSYVWNNPLSWIDPLGLNGMTPDQKARARAQAQSIRAATSFLPPGIRDAVRCAACDIAKPGFSELPFGDPDGVSAEALADAQQIQDECKQATSKKDKPDKPNTDNPTGRFNGRKNVNENSTSRAPKSGTSSLDEF